MASRVCLTQRLFSRLICLLPLPTAKHTILSSFRLKPPPRHSTLEATMQAESTLAGIAQQVDNPRVFAPLYVPKGDPSVDRLAFVHILEKLKTQKRTGWVNHKIPGPESISDHMYRMAILAMLTSDQQLDISKCVMMCLVHDLAEAHVGDIAPSEGISKQEKSEREAKAMKNFVYDMLHGSPAALRIEALWKEYEEGETAEARFVKDLDRFEMASQALEYEQNHGAKTLQPFFDSSIPKIRHPEVKSWGEDLLAERERLKEQS